MLIPRAILALALTLAALSPAHATAEHDYAKGEYAIIAGGRAPNGKLSIAAHGSGEGGRDKFRVYLMAEPGHRRLAVLDDISENNNLDTAPDSYHAGWSPDSHYVAVSFRSERHILTLNIYRIEGGRAQLIAAPDLFRDMTGRKIDRKTDGDMRASRPGVEWQGPRRYRFSDHRLFVMQDAGLADKIGAFGKSSKMDDGRYSIEFSAEAVVDIDRGGRFRIGKPEPGAFWE
ncbi:hypothetical protein [Bradyrhizobium sp. CCGUVB23]|uniref:hypothetical protein n=1 Tax=Bradyrhizobium sp. CCGUVB23 TaxID=2949630 RepID=UPI0020B416F7|nr:hypothetical protein [Bradyrhizobium sp. CCGUVB23]MCP3462484.1 hypothetical protein [Bradyrhizobium sp. CCGUVB23]